MKPETPPEEIDASLWDANSAAFFSRLAEASPKLNKALRERLVKLNKDADLPAEVKDRLAPRCQSLNVEALAEWLEAGGWDKLTPEENEKTESRFIAAWPPERTPEIYMSLVSLGGEPYSMMGAAFPWIPRNTPKELRGPFQMAADALMKELSGGQDGTEERPAYYALGLECLAAWMSEPGGRLRLAETCLHPWNKKDKGKDWLNVLAAAWLDEQAAEEGERLKKETAARPLRVPSIRIKGQDFAYLPKLAAGMSWALGGPGVKLSAVQMDGHDYKPAPALAAAIVPASYALLPADHAKTPHQTVFPIDLTGDDDAPPLAVSVVGATQYAITPAAGKLSLYILAAALGETDGLLRTSIKDLTERINPQARRLNPEHYKTAGKGLWKLQTLRLYLPNGWADRVFYIPRAPWKDLTPDEYETPLVIGLDPHFSRTLADVRTVAGNAYAGAFLIDITGAMSLPTIRPSLLRLYTRAASHWNAYWKPGTAGEPDPGRIPTLPARRWAAMTNYLPPSAVKGSRRKMSESIHELIKDAERLDALGLLKIAKLNREEVRLIPPDVYLEAWHAARAGAARMPGPE